MAEPVTNELMYEILKSIQAQVAITREDMEDSKSRFSSAERQIASVDTRLAMLRKSSYASGSHRQSSWPVDLFVVGRSAYAPEAVKERAPLSGRV